jgi:hypothetical protein
MGIRGAPVPRRSMNATDILPHTSRVSLQRERVNIWSLGLITSLNTTCQPSSLANRREDLLLFLGSHARARHSILKYLFNTHPPARVST